MSHAECHGGGCIAADVAVRISKREDRLSGASKRVDGARVPSALVGGTGLSAIDAGLVGIASATIERVVGVGPATFRQKLENVETGSGTVVLRSGELNTSQTLDAAGSIVGGRVCDQKVW